jgi:hypothetical protein
LKRGKPLQAKTALKRGTTRLKPISDAKRAQRPAKNAVTRQVFERDGYRCQIAPLVEEPCFGRLTPHHLKKEGQGGEHSMSNLIAACVFHNDWVEDHPIKAKALGLVR